MEEAKERISKGESRRSVARSLNINECTLRKRLKSGIIPKNLERFKPIFSEQMEKELIQHIKKLNTLFYGVTLKQLQTIAFQFATANNLSHRFNENAKKLANVGQ
jgi:hypothetical protein